MTQKATLKQAKREDVQFEVMNRDQIARILGTLEQEKAFFFYEDVGRPTGDSATSLTEFCARINTVSSAALLFHLKRGDFESWIKHALGDTELANNVSRIRKTRTAWKRENTLRKKLYSVLRDRLVELKDLWRHALMWPESTTK